MRIFFNKHKIRILIYLAKETTTDPYRKIKEFEIITAIPINAVVSDLNFTQIQWKMQGVDSAKAKQIIIHKRDLKTLKNSYKIRIDDEDYEGWRVKSQLQYRQYEDYVQAYIYLKDE